MSRSVNVDIINQTRAISQEGFGLALLFDPTSDFGYVEITDPEEIPEEAGELAGTMAEQFFSQSPNPGTLAMAGVLVDVEPDNIGDALAEVSEDNSDWYALLLASREQSEIEDAASWIPGNKIFITQPLEEDYDSLENYSLMFDNVGIFPHTEENDYDAAIAARMLTTDPGSATWKFKTLNGVDPNAYSSADVSEMIDPELGPAMNPYIREKGTNITAEGKSGNGTFLDIERAIDWLTARLEENIFFQLVNNEKVAFVDEDISIITSAIDEILQVAVDNGVIATDEEGVPIYEINVPSRADVPTNDRANRKLSGVFVEAEVAGAVHTVSLTVYLNA